MTSGYAGPGGSLRPFWLSWGSSSRGEFIGLNWETGQEWLCLRVHPGKALAFLANGIPVRETLALSPRRVRFLNLCTPHLPACRQALPAIAGPEWERLRAAWENPQPEAEGLIIQGELA